MDTFVLFIGGYQASQTDISLWTASAGQQTPSDWTFDGFFWPPSAAHADSNSALSAFGERGINEALKKIEDHMPGDVFIVGHSSGCAIANAIDEALTKKIEGKQSKADQAKVNLVALDGFVPSQGQLGRGNTQVWSAENGANKSLNYTKLQKRIGGRLKKYPANKQCTNIWSLHFSLVNSNTSDKMVNTNQDLGNGYLNCRANLCWVPASP
jgi:hypothetical protein